MLSIEKCRQILNKGERKYSLEEAKELANLLRKISIIEKENFKKYAKQKSCNLHKSID